MQPGPLLDEVLDELRGANRDVGVDTRGRVLDEVRAAWVEETEEVIVADELDFAGASPPRASEATTPEATDDPAAKERARREPEVRHRFDRDGDEGAAHPRRLITHRDRPRGRPPKKPGGSDPPS